MITAKILDQSYITKRHPYRVMVVDSERKTYNLVKKGFQVELKLDRASTADTALQMLGLQEYDLIILQLRLPLFSGLGLAERIKRLKPNITLLPISEKATDSELKKIRSLGYPEPMNIHKAKDEFEAICQEFIIAESRFRMIEKLKSELKSRYGFDRMLSVSKGVNSVYEKILKVASSRVPVLVTGESGTGKELVARMIHETGDRSKKPFLTVNCAAVPEGLLESQFFGHEKGSFTGASDRVPGKFELAHDGTLFLDEIGEMSPALQAKLLRVLEYGEFERVGGIEPINVEVRLITATNRDLELMVREGKFRADLLYRINVFSIKLPSLAERSKDIELLTYHFLRRACLRNNRQVRYIDSGSIRILQEYPWAGNIRELENAVERALILSENIRLTEADFPIQFEWSKKNSSAETVTNVQENLTQHSIGIKPLKELEAEAISAALLSTEGNISIAAKYLGIGRTTLYNKIEEYNLNQFGTKI